MTKFFDTDNIVLGANPSSHKSRPGQTGQWQSANGYDLMVPERTKVYSLTDGTVTSMTVNPGRQGSVYGDRVTVSSSDDEIFYTHIKSVVLNGQNVKIGDLIGMVVRWEDNPNQTHLHVASRYKDIRNYVDFKTWAIIDGISDNNNNKLKDGPIANFYRALGQKIAIPAALAALPGLVTSSIENKENRIIEEIKRIKKLM